MHSFDQSLKFLLQHDPADFIGFALDDRSIRILGAVPSVLPARGRDVDGAYLIARGEPLLGTERPAEQPHLAHIEMFRRHESAQQPARPGVGAAPRAGPTGAVGAGRPHPRRRHEAGHRASARRHRSAPGPHPGRAVGPPGRAIVRGRGGRRTHPTHAGGADGGATDDSLDATDNHVVRLALRRRLPTRMRERRQAAARPAALPLASREREEAGHGGRAVPREQAQVEGRVDRPPAARRQRSAQFGRAACDRPREIEPGPEGGGSGMRTGERRRERRRGGEP